MAGSDSTHGRLSGTDSVDIGSQNAASIRVENLTKVYDTQGGQEVVFEDLNFEVEPGSFVSLIGRSGCGKSTLLNIISGVLEATSGEVRFVREQDPEEETELGHVFQDPTLLPWNTCVENIEYVHENNPDYTDDLARKYLDMVGLSDHYDKYPTRLSGGQRQRVGIARAFSIDPHILLMDEPFSALDEITAEELRAELLDLWKQLRKTVLFVTHDITEAIELSDRILMLGDGEIYGDVEIPLERPRSVDSEAFLKFRQEAIKQFQSIQTPEEG